MLALLVIFLNDALLPGRVLSPADAIFDTQLYATKAPDGFDRPTNPLLFDQVYQFTPWRYFARESIRAGELPLWNPHSLAGTPFVATMQSAVFYPVHLLLVLVPFEETFGLRALIQLWIAGFFTYLLARRYGLRMPAALIAATSFMLSGFLVSWLGHPHVNVAVWLPALVLIADRLALAEDRRGIVQNAALLGLVTGVQFTGGHIETSLDILLGTGLYVFLRWGGRTLDEMRTRRRSLWSALRNIAALPLAYLLGAGIAAIQLLPFLEWLPLSAEYQHRSEQDARLFDPVFVKNLVALPVAIFPNIYSSPTWDHPYWSFNPWGNFNESVLYIGAVSLILAGVAMLARWRGDRLVRTWTLIAGITLAIALQLPLFDWINQLPGRELAHPNRLRLVTAFALSILAGFGAQAIWSDETARRWFRRLAGVIVVSGVVLFVAGGLILPRVEGWAIEEVQRRLDRAAAENEDVPRTFEYCQTRAEECVRDVIAAFSPGNVEMYVPALIALAGLLVLALWSRSNRSMAVLQAAILFLVVIDLVSFGEGYNPSVAAKHFYPEPAIFAQIEPDQNLARMTALEQTSYPDAHMMHGLSDVRGLDFPTRWYDDYLNVTGERIPWFDYGVLLSDVDSPLLSSLNIRYVITSSRDRIDSNEALRLMAEGENVYLAELAEVTPRARMVYRVTVVPDDDAALGALRQNPTLVREQIVLLGRHAEDAAAHRVPAEGATGSVELVSYGARRAQWMVTSTEPGFLFLSDAYYPGWKAYVDGEPLPILRANVAFRAVPIPAGQHEVKFRYEPASVRFGLVVSLLSLAVTLGLLVWSVAIGSRRSS